MSSIRIDLYYMKYKVSDAMKPSYQGSPKTRAKGLKSLLNLFYMLLRFNECPSFTEWLHSLKSLSSSGLRLELKNKSIVCLDTIDVLSIE